jgi:hypothetical protein
MPDVDFGYDSANEVFTSLAPAPEPEPPRLSAARTLLEKTPADARDTVGAELIRQAKGPAEVEALHTMVRGMLADDQRQADEALASKIAQAMKVEEPPKPERPTPYIDDSGALRSSDGRVLDAEDAAETLRQLATTDHSAANTLLDQLEAGDPTMAARVVDQLGASGDDG